MKMTNAKFRLNGNFKKRALQGGVGASIIALVSILSPILTGYDTRISALEKSQVSLCIKVQTLESLPAKIDKLRDDIKNLEKLLILCNKDNPDLIKYLELNK
jgi:hypothetical protein